MTNTSGRLPDRKSLEAGRIVERGNHAELLRQGGRYASLYALQSAGGEPPERPS
jgi:hypothetical protein